MNLKGPTSKGRGGEGRVGEGRGEEGGGRGGERKGGEQGRRGCPLRTKFLDTPLPLGLEPGCAVLKISFKKLCDSMTTVPERLAI